MAELATGLPESGQTSSGGIPNESGPQNGCFPFEKTQFLNNRTGPWDVDTRGWEFGSPRLSHYSTFTYRRSRPCLSPVNSTSGLDTEADIRFADLMVHRL